MPSGDDGGFFGPNWRYYVWMSQIYKAGRNPGKLKYWMYQKEAKEAIARRQKQRRYPKRVD